MKHLSHKKIAIVLLIIFAFGSLAAYNRQGIINLATQVIGQLAVLNGGTGAGTAANARVNLGAQAELGYTPVANAQGSITTALGYTPVANAQGSITTALGYTPPANTQGSITTALGYTPPANTQGSITTALGYTPPANTQGSITTALGYTPPANTQGSITTALGYTPVANAQGSITTALGYTPVANAQGSITTALGYTPVANTLDSVSAALNDLIVTQWRIGNTIGTGNVTFVAGTGISLSPTYANGFGTATITNTGGTTTAGGMTYNQAGGITYMTVVDDNFAIGSTTVPIQTKMYVGGNFKVDGTITATNFSGITTYWSDILGAPHTGTTNNSYFKTNTLENNKILIGKPQVLPIAATTTSYTSGDFQLINLQSGTSSTIALPQATQAGTQLLLRMHGTTTVDSSANNYTISAFGVTGTTGVTFNTGTFSAYFDGVDDYLTVPSSINEVVGTTGTTIKVKFQTPTPTTTMKLLSRASGSGVGFWQLRTLASDGRLQFYHEDGLGTPIIDISGGIVTANSIHYAEVVKAVSANSMYLFLDGNLVAQGTLTQSMGDSGQPLYIGLDSALNQDFKGYMKDIEILQGVALHTATFTVDTTTNYELATMNRQAMCSTDGIERITVQTYSTETAKPAIIFNNGSLTAFGYNAESGMSAPGSTTAYSTESLNAEIATNFVIKSKDNKGRNFQKLTETCLDKVVNTNLWSWNPINHKNINRLEAEAIAKEAFVKQGKQDWELLHADEYILATTVNGTETTTVRDYVRMEKDYKYYIELEWAYSLEQTGWIDTVKDNLESDTTIRRRGFRYDDSTTPEELKEPGGIGLSEATALSYKAIQELEAIVGSLSTTLKNQEIEYKEEVDNLYNLINAIIAAVIALGGVGGWTTLRRKRKGT